jgi:NAD(P)-dependent dehydrogenase (short-subunit alcohol dehydrogenase family)
LKVNATTKDKRSTVSYCIMTTKSEMKKSLIGKVAIVTGASQNLGRAYAEMLGMEGASVVVHYHGDNKKSDAEDVAANIRKAGSKAIVEQADLTKTAEIKKLFDRTMEEFGRLDILINTAGKVLKKPFVDISEEEYDDMFAVNAKAAFFCMQEAAKRMANNGRIVNMKTSLVGATTPYYSAYAGSKAPLEDFACALAKEIGNRGITVNNIAPGPLNTSFFYPAETKESIEYFKQQSINDQLGEIRDIVPLAKFLVSPEANWVTAQTIFINGGFLTR